MQFYNSFYFIPSLTAFISVITYSFVFIDEAIINEEINRLRDELKPKVENIRNLEGEPDFKFNLKPLNKDEVAAMRSILPKVI